MRLSVGNLAIFLADGDTVQHYRYKPLGCTERKEANCAIGMLVGECLVYVCQCLFLPGCLKYFALLCYRFPASLLVCLPAFLFLCSARSAPR